MNAVTSPIWSGPRSIAAHLLAWTAAIGRSPPPFVRTPARVGKAVCNSFADWGTGEISTSLPSNKALPSLLARMRRYRTCFARSSESGRSQGPFPPHRSVHTDICVEEKHGAGVMGGNGAQFKWHARRMVLGRLPSGFPAMPRRSDAIPTIQCCVGSQRKEDQTVVNDHGHDSGISRDVSPEEEPCADE